MSNTVRPDGGPLLLAIDVGNTNIVFGIFDGERLGEIWRLETLRGRTADELRVLVSRLFAEAGLETARVSGVVLSSVVPPLTGTVARMARDAFGWTPSSSTPPTPACASAISRRKTSGRTGS